MVLNYVCRASKARKDGLSPIELSIIINGERSVITLDRKIQSQKFNSVTQKVKGDKEINEYLETIRKKCYQIENELIKMDSLDIETFVHSFKYGLKKKEDSLLQVFDKHNELYKQSVMSGKVDNTAYYKYLKARERVSDYIRTLNLTDIKLKDVTMAFIEGYQNYCLMSLKTNTTNKQLKMLKKILQFAVNERLMEVNPFKMVLKEEKLDYEVLSAEEVSALLCREFTDERVSRVRDLFCLQCYTGLAYIDLTSLSKEDIVDDVIIKRRKKTDVQFVVPLLPAAKSILEKYDYNLPIISNQKYNMTLKLLGEIMGYKRNLHTHLARHTFACILLNSGVDMKTISRTMGHSSMRTTEKIYAQMSNDTVVSNILSKVAI